MNLKFQLRLLTLFTFINFVPIIKCSKKAPNNATVLIGFSLKNREVHLPYFLSFLHGLSFPKNQICLLIFLGKNVDKTSDILQVWLDTHGEEYKNVDIQNMGDFWNIQQMKEDILIRGRDINIDYVMIVEPFTFIIEPNIVQHLINKERVIAAVMMRSNGLYSNFWGDMTEDYDYKSSQLYHTIYSREIRGCFKVPLVHGCVVIDLRARESQHLSFLGQSNYGIALAISARLNNISTFICNDMIFGFILSTTSNSDDYDIRNEVDRMKEIQDLTHKFLSTFHPLEIFVSSGFVKYPEIDNLGMDQIYIINLLKEPMKRKIMEERLKDIGLEAQFFEGVDGMVLNSTYLMSIGANQLKAYDDIYMTTEALGTFLSHYFIWKDVIKNKYEKVLIFEDDTKFEDNFKDIVKGALQDIHEYGLAWELLFLNRGTAMGPLGNKVKHSKHLQEVGYGLLSTSGYLLSSKGAKKLATSAALSEIIPVDEYILMMHSSEYRELRSWENNYGPADLKVFLIDPEPSHKASFHKDFRPSTNTLYATRTSAEKFGVVNSKSVLNYKNEL